MEIRLLLNPARNSVTLGAFRSISHASFYFARFTRVYTVVKLSLLLEVSPVSLVVLAIRLKKVPAGTFFHCGTHTHTHTHTHTLTHARAHKTFNKRKKIQREKQPKRKRSTLPVSARARTEDLSRVRRT